MSTAWAPGATILAISARCRFIASVLQVGRRLQRLWQALRARPQARTDPGSGLLGPRPTPVLHHGGPGRKRASQGSGQEAARDLAVGAGAGPPDQIGRA